MSCLRSSLTRQTAVWLVLLLASPFALATGSQVNSQANSQAESVPTILESDQRHRQVSRMVTRFVERAHYSKINVDDELSAVILNN